MISSVALTVRDLSRSTAFYEKILNFKGVARYTLNSLTAGLLFGMDEEDLTVEVAVLSLGAETLELMEFQTLDSTHEIPADSESNDRWFQHMAIVVSDMVTAYEHLKLFEVNQISPSPQTLPGYLEAAGISAFYFKDPDGHVLELIHFPAGLGDSKWQEQKEDLFLGIDHSAIVVKNTEESLPFYQKLGLEKKSQTENYGPEQESLNQVKGARLLVTGLKFDGGMGIELLDFKNPTDGRPFPKQARPGDLIHWHIKIPVNDIGQVFDEFTASDYTFISRGIATNGNPKEQEKHGFLVRDTDGHAVLLVEA